MSLRLSFLCVCMMAASGPTHAGSYGTELPFAAGTGARASGLGLAAVSLPGAPSAQYFNPALSNFARRRNIEFYRTTLFDSKSTYHAASYAHPSIDYGTAAVTILRLGVGGIEERDDVNNLISSDLKNTQTRILLGYSTDLHPMLTAGVNLKVDNQSFGGFSGTGVGVDIGFLGSRDISESSIFRRVRAGVAVENLIEPSVKLDVDDVADPLRLTAGTSFDCRYGDFDLTTALDVTSPRLSPARLRFGQEVAYAGMFALRLGLDGTTATFGLGGRHRTASIDYAYRNEDLGSNHRVSLSVAFGSTIDERLADKQRRIDEELHERVQRRMAELESTQLDGLAATADSLFEGGQYERALDQYEMILLWSPDHAHSKRRLELCRYNVAVSRAHELIGNDDYLSARQLLRKATTMHPPDDRAAQMLARCDERIAEAQDRTNMIDRLLKNSIDRYAEGEYAEALRGFEEVLRLDAANALATEYEQKSRTNIRNASQRLVVEARTRVRKRDFSSAVALLERALALTPENELIAAELRKVREHRRRDELDKRRVEASPERPVKIRNPDDSRFLSDRFELGVELFEQGRFEQAADQLMQVWTVAPEYRDVATPLTKAYLFLGMKVYSEEKYAEAIRIWEKILTIEPGNVKARRYLEKTREEAAKLGGMLNG